MPEKMDTSAVRMLPLDKIKTRAVRDSLTSLGPFFNFPQLVLFARGTADHRHFDELRPGSDDGDNFHQVKPQTVREF